MVTTVESLNDLLQNHIMLTRIATAQYAKQVTFYFIAKHSRTWRRTSRNKQCRNYTFAKTAYFRTAANSALQSNVAGYATMHTTRRCMTCYATLLARSTKLRRRRWRQRLRYVANRELWTNKEGRITTWEETFVRFSWLRCKWRSRQLTGHSNG